MYLLHPDSESYAEIQGYAVHNPTHISVRFVDIGSDDANVLFELFMSNSNDDFHILRSKCRASVVLHQWFTDFCVIFHAGSDINHIRQLFMKMDECVDLFAPEFRGEFGSMMDVISNMVAAYNKS